MKPKLKNLKGFNSKKANNSSASSNSSYLAEDENFKGFSSQLEKLGLQLRDITGDGNCCFRALSDQMFGNESQHLDFRKRVCQYIRQNRDEFEPFVAALIDDDEEEEQNSNGNVNKPKKSSFLSANKKLDAFEKYIKNLEQPGTYADNGCLVAFARLYQLNINIHQLAMPIWTISGVDKKMQPIRELHLSYHNGEHYSSIRPLGDNSRTPTNINFHQDSSSPPSRSSKSVSQQNGQSKPKKSSQPYENSESSYYYDEASSASLTDSFHPLVEELNDLDMKIEQIIEITKCLDINLIKECLIQNDYDTEQTVNSLLTSLALNSNEDNSENDKKASSSSKKVDKKAEKKERQMERQRIKILEQREKELLAQQKQQIKLNQTANNLNNHSNNENSGNSCSSSLCNNCAPMPNGSAASCSGGVVDYNVSLSNIETKNI